jgi:hypothetical protein
MAEQAHREVATMRLEKRVSGEAVHCPPAKAKSSSGVSDTIVEPKPRSSNACSKQLGLDIDYLVAAITPSKRLDEISFGRPVGRELL